MNLNGIDFSDAWAFKDSSFLPHPLQKHWEDTYTISQQNIIYSFMHLLLFLPDEYYLVISILLWHILLRENISALYKEGNLPSPFPLSLGVPHLRVNTSDSGTHHFRRKPTPLQLLENSMLFGAQISFPVIFTHMSQFTSSRTIKSLLSFKHLKEAMMLPPQPISFQMFQWPFFITFLWVNSMVC